MTRASRAAAWRRLRAAPSPSPDRQGGLVALAEHLHGLAGRLQAGDAHTIAAGPGGIAAGLLAAWAPQVHVTGLVGDMPFAGDAITYWLSGERCPGNLRFGSGMDKAPPVPKANGGHAPLPPPGPDDRMVFDPALHPGPEWVHPALDDDSRAVAYWAERGLTLAEIASRLDLPIDRVTAGAEMLTASRWAVAAPLAGGTVRWHGHATRGFLYPDPAEWVLPGLWAISQDLFAGHPLVVAADRPPFSYDAAGRAVRAVAASLMAEGLGKGDRVIICSSQCIEFMVHVWACWHLGVVVLPLPPDTTGEAMATMVARGRIDAVLTQGETAGRGGGGSASWREIPMALPHTGTDRPAPQVAISPDDPALLLTTSGTTGESKLVLLSHRNAVMAGHANVAELGLHEIDRLAQPSGTSDIGGIRNTMISTVHAGAAWVLMPDPALGHVFRVVEDMIACDATVLCLYPVMLEQLQSQAEAGRLDWPARARVIFTGGSAVAGPARRHIAATGNVTVVVSFGMTEAPIVLSVAASPGSDGSNSTGRAIACLTSMRNADGQPAPAGTEGALWVLSDRTMTGYFRDGAPDRGAFSAGWLRNGDRMRRDDRGWHWHAGRTDPWIKLETGQKVHLSTVETALRAHPQVGDLVVIPCVNMQGHEGMVAFVAPTEPGPAVARLSRHVRETLGRDFAPVAIILIDSLPRNSREKVSLATLYPLLPDGWRPR